MFEKHFKESRTACIWTRFMDYDCCYYYLLLTVIAETNIWRCFLRGGLQSWYVVILQKYIGKKDTILRSFCWHFPLNLLHGFSDKFLLRSALEKAFIYLQRHVPSIVRYLHGEFTIFVNGLWLLAIFTKSLFVIYFFYFIYHSFTYYFVNLSIYSFTFSFINLCVFEEGIYWLLPVIVPMYCQVFSFLFKNLYVKAVVRTFFNKNVEDSMSKYFYVVSLVLCSSVVFVFFISIPYICIYVVSIGNVKQLECSMNKKVI